MKNLDIKKRYKKYPEEIQEYMEDIKNSLLDKYGEIHPQWLISLDTLAMNIDIMMKAKQDFDTEGFHHKDAGGIVRKSGGVQIFNTAQTAALKIMNSFGLNPMSEARIKTNKNERMMQEYVNSLTGGDIEDEE